MTDEQDQKEREALDRCNRWRMDVELTFDMLPEDIEDKYPGDTAKDFADRAYARIRPALNALIQNSEFKHYHIKVTPNPCIEFD